MRNLLLALALPAAAIAHDLVVQVDSGEAAVVLRGFLRRRRACGARRRRDLPAGRDG